MELELGRFIGVKWTTKSTMEEKEKNDERNWNSESYQDRELKKSFFLVFSFSHFLNVGIMGLYSFFYVFNKRSNFGGY